MASSNTEHTEQVVNEYREWLRRRGEAEINSTLDLIYDTFRTIMVGFFDAHPCLDDLLFRNEYFSKISGARVALGNILSEFHGPGGGTLTCTCGGQSSSSECNCVAATQNRIKRARQAIKNYNQTWDKNYDKMVQLFKIHYETWFYSTYMADAVNRIWDDANSKIKGLESDFWDMVGKVDKETLAQRAEEVKAEVELIKQETHKNITQQILAKRAEFAEWEVDEWLARDELNKWLGIDGMVNTIPAWPHCKCNNDFDPKAEVDGDTKVIASPIVLDLDGDGVETTDVNSGKTMFDLDGDGVKNRTGWANSDDGFLVFDRNNDGIINDGRELFGNSTLRYDGSGPGYPKSGCHGFAGDTERPITNITSVSPATETTQREVSFVSLLPITKAIST